MGNSRIKLAQVDESQEYETDVAIIEYDSAGRAYILKTATGCSCWDGSYDEERFSTLADLEKSIITEDRDFNPSLRGTVEIADAARKKAKELKLGNLGHRVRDVLVIIEKLSRNAAG